VADAAPGADAVAAARRAAARRTAGRRTAGRRTAGRAAPRTMETVARAAALMARSRRGLIRSGMSLQLSFCSYLAVPK